MNSIYNSDIDCIKKVKIAHDGEALQTLVGRHSGIYLEMIHRYMPNDHDNITKRELISEKDSFIYQCALDFDPNIKIKFSTYIGNMIKWKCMNIHNVSKRRKFEPINDVQEVCQQSNLHADIESTELKTLINGVLQGYPDRRAKKIFRLRYVDGQKNKVMPWKKIAKELDMSIQGCINIHNKLIKTIQKKYEQNNPQR
jgi:RNA polymerase sigma factor (sigma-70 family)